MGLAYGPHGTSTRRPPSSRRPAIRQPSASCCSSENRHPAWRNQQARSQAGDTKTQTIAKPAATSRLSVASATAAMASRTEAGSRRPCSPQREPAACKGGQQPLLLTALAPWVPPSCDAPFATAQPPLLGLAAAPAAPGELPEELASELAATAVPSASVMAVAAQI